MSFEPGNNLMRQQRDRYRNELAALRLEFAVVKTRVEALHCENEDLKEELGALRRVRVTFYQKGHFRLKNYSLNI